MTESAHDRAAVGLCAECLHAHIQQSARGSTFWRCALADRDARFRRYPPLPVRACSGHERGEPVRARGADPPR
jgi:hypothetical protein